MDADAIARKSIVETQVKVNTADLDAFNQRLDAMEAGADEVSKAVREASKYVKEFSTTLRSAGNEMKKFKDAVSTTNKSASDSYKKMANDVKEQFKKMDTAMDKTVTSNKKLADSTDSSFDKLKQHASDGADKYQAKMDALIAKNKEVQASIVALGRQNFTPTTTGHYNSNTTSGRVRSTGSSSLESKGNTLINNGMNMSLASLGLGAGFVKGAQEATNLQNEFVKINNLAATGGEKAAEAQKNVNEMQKQGTDLSTRYGVSQEKIASGYEELIRRGYTTNQALAAQKTLVQGAIASGDDYSDVVKNATAALEGFGMRSDDTAKMTENTRKAVNQMAYAADLTATDFQGLGDGMRYVAATAHTSNQSLSETASALGVLANHGQESTVAGTGLRKILNSLVSPSSKTGIPALESIGLSPKDLQDSKGHLKSLSDIFGTLNKAISAKGLNDTEKTDVFHRLFGTTGQESALILSQSADQLKKLNGQVAESQNQKGGGYIQALSEKNMKSYQAQISRFKTAWEAFNTSMANALMPTVTNVLHGLTDVFNVVNNMPKGTKSAIAGFTLFIAAIGPVSLAVGTVFKAINSTRKAIGWLSGSLRSKPSETFVGGMKRQSQQAKQAAANFEEAEAMMKRTGNRAGEAYTLADKRQVRSNIAGADLGTLRDKESRGAFKKAKEVQVDGGFKKSGFLSRFRGVKSTGTRFGKLGDASVVSTVAKDAGEIGKFGKIANIAGKGVVGLNIATSALGMLGTNDKNMFKNLGGAGGAAAGGAIGAIGGPIGIAAGSAIGQWLGTKGGEIVQRSVNKSSKMYNDPSHDANKSTNGIADSLRNFNNNSELINSLGNNKQSKEMRGILSGQNKDAIKSARSAVSKYTDSGIKSSESDADKLNGYLMNNAKIDSKKIAKSDKDLYKKRQKDANDALTALAKTEGQGGEKRQKAIKRANEAISKLMTSSNAGQRRIMAQLTTSTGKMSDKEAGKLISNSSKIANKQIANANREYKQSKAAADNKYKSVLDAANRQYYDTGQISKSQYNEIIKNAKGDRDDSIKTANDKRKGIVSEATKQKNKVVEQARKQTKDHLASVDEETGKSLDFWGRWGKRFKGIWNGISSWFGGIWKGITSQISNIGSSVGKMFKGTAIGKGIEKVKATDKKFWGGVGRWVQGYATGTKGKYPNGLPKATNAIVNDGDGRELIQYPDGNMYLPKGRNVHMMLPKGTHVFNAEDTRRLIGTQATHFAKGTTKLDKIHGNLSVSLNMKSVRAAVNATKSGMTKVQKMIMAGYAKSNDSVKKTMETLTKNSGKNWKDIGDDTSKLTDKSSKDTIKTYTSLGKQLDKTMDNIHDGMNDNTKAMVNDFGNIMGKLAGLATKAMRATIEQLNNGFSGINSALGQFGNSSVLKPIRYAAGSNGKLPNDQIAMVNDATTGPRQEAIVRDSKVYLPKGQNTVMKLNKGDQVLNGRQTQKLLSGIQHYAKGSGVSDDQLEKIAKQNAKHPDSAFQSEFLDRVKSLGSNLQKGLTGASKGAAKSVGNDWSKAMWSLIENTIGGSGGSGSKGEFLKYAEKIGTGKPYVYGGFDCSKLIQDSLAHFGIQIGRDTVSQSHGNQLNRLGKDISKAEVGDLVYFGTSGANAHVGIVSDKEKGLMMNQTPPSGRISTIQSAINVDGLDGYYSVKGLSSKDTKSDKGSSALDKLVKSQLGGKALKWISKHLGNMGGGSANPVGDGVSRWRPSVVKALRELNLSTSGDMVNKVLRQISTESGGNPNAIGGDDGLADGKAMGLMQVKPGTFAAYGKAALGKWNNGYASIYAGLNYAKHTYGPGLNFLGQGHGYANGGWSNMPAVFGEVPGQPEVVINPQRASADGLIQQAIDARVKSHPASPMREYASHVKTKAKTRSLRSTFNKLLKKSGGNSKPSVNVTFNNTFNITGNPTQGNLNQMTGQMKAQLERFCRQFLGLEVEKTINNRY